MTATVLLQEAVNLLACPQRWTQGASCRSITGAKINMLVDTTPPYAFDLLGALYYTASKLGYINNFEGNRLAPYLLSERALCQAALLSQDPEAEYPILMDAIAFNDAPTTTYEIVVKVYHTAIQMLRQLELT